MVRQLTIFDPIGKGFNEALCLIADKNIPEHHDTPHPFVKWVGGKRLIVKDLLARVPDVFNSYFEPFVGGGALFWNIPRRGKAYLSDINSNLVITYRMIRDNVEEVISRLEYHKKHHNEKYYAAARKELLNAQKPIEIASLFIYMNKTCYNGLYRVNKSGMFNVPIGRYDDPKIANVYNLRKCSQFLANVDIFRHSFSQIRPNKGDFLYLDPPYHETFSAYDGSGFGDNEHEELAAFCKQLDQKGVLFMLSNSDTPFIRQLYNGFDMSNVNASLSFPARETKGKRKMSS